ncbi:hypothetical protein GQX74_004274 [Glossina fuscipes]|nr:hypothetical protein GQX74_004274 [Glossina fuscipes]
MKQHQVDYDRYEQSENELLNLSVTYIEGFLKRVRATSSPPNRIMLSLKLTPYCRRQENILNLKSTFQLSQDGVGNCGPSNLATGNRQHTARISDCKHLELHRVTVCNVDIYLTSGNLKLSLKK